MPLLNSLHRTPNPRAVLAQMAGRNVVKRGGLLVLTTPFTWMEDFTPVQAWLGGYERDGVRQDSFEGLKSELIGDFELLVKEEVFAVLVQSDVGRCLS